MTPPGSGPGAKPPAGTVVRNAALTRVVRPSAPGVPIGTAPTNIAPLPSLIQPASGYAVVPAPQVPVAKTGGVFGLLRRVFGGGDTLVVAKPPAVVAAEFDPSRFFGFRSAELAGAPTGAIPVGSRPTSFRVGATLALIQGDGFRSRGQYEEVSPRGSGDTAPNPVVQARRSRADGEGKTAVLTGALAREAASVAASPTRPRPQPVARPVSARPAAPTAPATDSDAAGPTIDSIVGDARRVHAQSKLSISGRAHRTQGISLTATQPTSNGSIRITAETLAAPIAEAMQVVTSDGLSILGIKNAGPAVQFAVVFEDAGHIRDLAQARGMAIPYNLDTLIAIDRGPSEQSRATPGSRVIGTNVGNVGVVGALNPSDLPIDQSRVPMIVVFIPWALASRTDEALYTRARSSALARLREALRKIRAALPASQSDDGRNGGGQRRR